MIRLSRAVAACAAVAFVTACAVEDDQGDDVLVQDTGAAIQTPVTQDPDPGPASAGMREVSVTLSEWSIDMSTEEVQAGAVAFDIHNTGSEPHTFEIEGGGEEWSTETIEPGGTVTMSVDLPAGEYKVYCPIDSAGINHESQGMVTTLRAN